MNLSTILLVCAIVAGLAGGLSARFRRWGTGVADIAIGLAIGVLFALVSTVVMVLAIGLNFFGIIHYSYLLIVVGFPIAAAWIVLPQLVNAERRTPFLGWGLAILAVAAVAIGLWATHVEPFRLQVDTQALGVSGVNEPLVLGVIADLQTRSIGSHEQAALDAILEGQPDVVVIPGDLFQLELSELDAQIPQFVGWLRQLADEVGHVFIVNGDVDFADVLEDLAEETGAIYLDDEITTVEVRDQDLVLVGISVDEDRPATELDPALDEQLLMETSREDLVIAISHRPDAVLELPADTTIDLMVSGHTHGGQVALPGIGPILTFTEVPKVVAAGGLHVVNGTPIYVSTGVGIERGQAPQLRFGVPPSVGLITVVPA